MTNGMEFVCTAEQEVMSEVIEAVLGTVRGRVTKSWIDAISDEQWPVERRSDVEALLAVEQRLLASRKRRRATGMGIELDLNDPIEFGLFVRLAAYSIDAEAWADGDQVLSTSDTGDHALFWLTPEEAELAARRLATAGHSFEHVLTFRE